MPRHCSAGGCKSRDTKESRKAGITFHKLPKGTAKRNLWINQSRRDGLWEPQTDFVYFCSKHFTPESFELVGYSGIRRIRDDAYPTLFEVTPEIKRKGRPRKQTNSTKTEPKPTSQDSGREDNEEDQTDKGDEAQDVPPTNGSNLDPAEDDMETDPKATSSPQAQPSAAQAGPAEEEAEDLSLQQEGASPPSSPRPVSPSRYMRRLPPPPGFHLPKEHSYAQICPLVWRRRYDRAIDCLEKALRQLNAARRRENRLRGSLLRLREKRLKHTLLQSRDRARAKGGRTAGRALFRGEAEERLSSPTNPDENDTDAEAEDNSGLFAGEHGEAADMAGWIPTTTDTKQQGSEEGGYCFYCGRGREDGGRGHAVAPPRGSKASGGDGQMSRAHKRGGESDNKRAAVSRRPEKKIRKKLVAAESEAAEDDCRLPRFASESKPEDVQVVVFESPIEQSAAPTPVLLQQQSQVQVDLQQMVAAGGSAHHFASSSQPVQSSHNMLLAESSAGSIEHVGWIEGWIEGCAEGQLLLIPVPPDDDGTLSVVPRGEIPLLTADVGEGDEGQCLENVSTDVRADDTQCFSGTSVVMREDVKEKLKEHLEGFQLQLSNEFID